MEIFKKLKSLSFRRKTILSAVISLMINVLFAVYNGVIGIYFDSWWLITMSVYYIMLGAMRFIAVRAELGIKKLDDEGEKFRKEIQVMRNSAILLLFLTFALIGTVVLTIKLNNVKRYGTIIMITIATFTFYKITMAIINAITARKHHSPICRVIRNISCAEAAMSVLPMQSSMIVSFEEEGKAMNFTFMTSATGMGICIVIMYLGISMLVSAYKEKGELK